MFQIKLNCIDHVSDSNKIDNGKVEDCLKERVEKNKMPHSKCYNVRIEVLPVLFHHHCIVTIINSLLAAGAKFATLSTFRHTPKILAL